MGLTWDQSPIVSAPAIPVLPWWMICSSPPKGKEMMPHWLSLTPAGRLAEVTDLQGAVVYLASEVSDFMTGSDLVIDGGYCAW